jgi:signal transduction histidine kinase
LNLHYSTPLQQAFARVGLRWLPLFLILILVFPLAVVLGVIRIHLDEDWDPVHSVLALNNADVVALIALGLVAAVPTVFVQRKLLDQLRAEAIRAENEAVVRVCNVVAREFAQPLTGTLAYSDILLIDSQSPTEAQRRALEGVREGVVRLDQLLYSLRDAVQDVQSTSGIEHFADVVVVAVNRRTPRRSTPAFDTERVQLEPSRVSP